jgi:hypothetical protein
MKDSANQSVDKPQRYLLWQADYVLIHVLVTEYGISWTPANNLAVTDSAQEKHEGIIEYLKLN